MAEFTEQTLHNPDFFILFIEGCLLVALAIVLSDTAVFVYMFIFLLFLDSFWGFLAKLAFTGAYAQSAERKWSAINIIAIAMLLGLSAALPDPISGEFSRIDKWAIFSVAAARTVADYSWCWNFYYPPSDIR